MGLDDTCQKVEERFFTHSDKQVGEQDLTPHQRELAEYLIGSLDDDGLLRKSLDSISDELAIYAGIDASPEDTNGKLRDARRLHSITFTSLLRARNWILKGPEILSERRTGCSSLP